jgi:hypothetical protein
MSRPQKIIPPIKGSFTEIINAVADGRGIQKSRTKDMANEQTAALPPPTSTPTTSMPN